jgi:hypothetical protein
MARARDGNGEGDGAVCWVRPEGEARVARMGEVEVGEMAQRQGIVMSLSKGEDEGGVGVGDNEDKDGSIIVICRRRVFLR